MQYSNLLLLYIQEEEEDNELVESLTQSCSNAANIENRPNRPSFVFDRAALDEVDSGRKSPLEGNEGRVSPINPAENTSIYSNGTIDRSFTGEEESDS